MNVEDKHLDIIAKVEETFGVSLKEFQKEVYINILAGKDVVVSAPAGNGKTFFFLSEMLDERDRTNMELKSRPRPSLDDETTNINNVILIISPLSRFMVDQTERLRKLELKCAFVGELQPDQAVKSAITKARYPVAFMTPVSSTEPTLRNALPSPLYEDKIKVVVIDEAHCISHW